MINRIGKPIVKQEPLSVPSLIRLNALAVKKIFVGLSYFEESEMEYGILMWTTKVLPRLAEMGHDKLKAHYAKELEIIVRALNDNDAGKYDREKDNFKRCGIDYRRAYKQGL